MVAAHMTEMTNLDVVLEDNLEEIEFKLYCGIDRSCVPEKLALGDFFKELRSTKDLLIQKYKATDERVKLHLELAFETGKLHSVVVKEVRYWMKLLSRRMRRTPRNSRPYRIDILYRVSDEVFTYILKFLTCVTCYGLEIENLQKGKVTFIKVWYKRKMELFLNDLIGENLPVKTVKGCRLQVLISCERLFTIKYRRTSEKLDISCYYGLWNQYQVPQHL